MAIIIEAGIDNVNAAAIKNILKLKNKRFTYLQPGASKRVKVRKQGINVDESSINRVNLGLKDWDKIKFKYGKKGQSNYIRLRDPIIIAEYLCSKYPEPPLLHTDAGVCAKIWMLSQYISDLIEQRQMLERRRQSISTSIKMLGINYKIKGNSNNDIDDSIKAKYDADIKVQLLRLNQWKKLTKENQIRTKSFLKQSKIQLSKENYILANGKTLADCFFHPFLLSMKGRSNVDEHELGYIQRMENEL